MKVVVIDPKLTVEASKGEWVPIRPGTDLAFVLAMQHVMLYELQKFDLNFLKTRTNAPYLVGPDGALPARQGNRQTDDVARAGRRAKPFDDPSFVAAPAPAASGADPRPARRARPVGRHKVGEVAAGPPSRSITRA